MADDKVALEIFIEADKANLSLGELEKGFDSMKERLKEVGRGSEEFKTLSTAMAQTTKEIKNIELGFEGLDREQVASELGSVAGGIGDITASLVLLGGENETIEQIGASIEKAMAISMGFKGAIEGLSSANKLYNNILKQGKVALIAKTITEKAAAAGTWLMTAAQTAFNVVMSMNPIALVVIAITALVAGFILLGKNIKKVIDFALLPMTLVIEGVKAGLRALGLMEESTAEQTKKAEEAKAAAVKKASEEKIKEYGKQITELKRLQKAHEELSDKVIGDMEFEVKMLKAKGENAVKAEWKLLHEKKKIANEAHKLIFDELQASRLQWEEKKKLGQQATDDDLANAKRLAKANKEAFEKTKKADQEIELYRATHNKGVQDRIDKEAEEAAAASKKRWEAGAADRAMARSKESQAKKDALMEDIERVEVDKTMQTEELDRHSIHIEGLISNEQILHDAKNFWHNKDLERIAEERAARLEAAKANLEGAEQLVGSIAALNSAALDNDLKKAGNNEAKKEQLRKASFEREKKLNIAMALINGAQALTSIFAQYPKFDGGFAMIAALASSVITTASTIAKIKATSYQGGGSPASSESAPSAGGAGAAGGGAAISPVSNTSTILGNQQVFVTETDITDTQNNVSVIEESATF